MSLWSEEVDLLRRHGVRLQPGLSEQEALRIELENDFTFPDDLRAFLMTALPVGPSFPDWRNLDRLKISDWMLQPYDGIAFDIEHSGFWWASWGPRPDDLTQALAVARKAVGQTPRLIPVYGHRFIPAQPTDAGNPVFSVHQTDIIYYGIDLRRYLRCEFNSLKHADAVHGKARYIPFWTDLVEAND